MDYSDEALIAGTTAGDVRAVARLITLIENGVPRARQLQRRLYKQTGRAHVIGVTGSPGAGKSTLVDGMAVGLRALGKRVAVIAVDPSSPFTGGAILGDRIRMNRTLEDSSIFVRSMATRGSLGGLAQATRATIDLLDAAGFDYVLVETVGVGQAEVDIVRAADTCVVVLVPGMGDSVQIIKAGIIEIADIFVINKADREGADLIERDLKVLLGLVERPADSWRAPIVQTVATDNKGLPELLAQVTAHQGWFASSPLGQVRKLAMMENSLLQLARTLLGEYLVRSIGSDLRLIAERCMRKELDPMSAVEQMLKRCAPGAVVL